MTKDVLEALRQFMAASGAEGEEQPLEAYMQQMKENMVERLQKLHLEQMAREAQKYEEVIEMRGLQMGSKESEHVELQAELDEANVALLKTKQSNAEERTLLESRLENTQGALVQANDERTRLRAHRDELLVRVEKLSAQLKCVAEDTDADTDALDAPASNKQLAELRKKDVLELRAELDVARKLHDAAKLKQQEQQNELGLRGEELTGKLASCMMKNRAM